MPKVSTLRPEIRQLLLDGVEWNSELIDRLCTDHGVARQTVANFKSKLLKRLAAEQGAGDAAVAEPAAPEPETVAPAEVVAAAVPMVAEPAAPAAPEALEESAHRPRRIHIENHLTPNPPNTVRIMRPGKWGNPFDWRQQGIAEAIENHAQWLLHGQELMEWGRTKYDPAKLRAEIGELRGKNLACTCDPGAPCHGDLLLALANGWELPAGRAAQEPAADATPSAEVLEAMQASAAERAERTQLKDHHRKVLAASAITEDRMALWESISEVRDLPAELRYRGAKVLPCMATEWATLSGERVPQIRLDNPIPDKDGKPIRYLFPKGSGGIVGTDAAFERDWANPHIPLLLVEGTKQFQAAASTINPEAPFAVPFGLAGCWGWSQDLKPSTDLLALPAEGRDVLVAFDADVASKWAVWEAARRLEKYLLGELMARSVRFLINPGTGGDSDGLDDLLGRQPTTDRRVKQLRHLIDSAVEHKTIKAPRKPARLSAFFDGANFRPASCWEYLSGENDLAMSGDVSVAVYRDGVFHNGTSLWWTRLVSETLSNDYRPEFEASVTKIALAQLKTEKRIIPFQQPEPVINFRNTLLNARTLERLEHTPRHLTLIQLPHAWEPEAECPVFLKWIEEVAPGQLEGLLDVCSQMLDLSEWPRMIAFLTGPTRSGKSTWIRILNALVGSDLRSNVSLHDLSRSSDDKFATSSLFGKVLNTFADLSAEDLHDLSMVKVLTGGDEFEAQRKNGHRFTMRNQAMLVFSANSIPATSENSAAFLARVAHFSFPFSFEGREDKTIEDHILANEVPGVLRLLVEALHRRKQRGNFLPRDPELQQAFAEKTDRVRMFLAECTAPGDRSERCILRSDLYQQFCIWVEEEHGGKAGRMLGKHKFNERVRLAGVDEFKPQGKPARWNLLRVDPESGEGALPKVGRGPSGVGVGGKGEGVAGKNTPSSPVLEGGPQIKSGEGQTGCAAADVAGVGGSGSTVSPVSPYCTTSGKDQCSDTKPLQCIKSGETGELEVRLEVAGFAGEAPKGVAYVATAEALPDPATLPAVIGFDLETFNRRTDLWRHLASLHPALGGEIRLAQISTGGDAPTLVVDVAVIGQPAIEWLRAIARDPERTLVGHNLLFDATYLIAAGIRPLCRWWDTMLASQLIGDLPINSLAAVVGHYLGAEVDKAEQTGDWGGQLTASQLAYAAIDARVVLPLREALAAQLEATGQLEVHRLDCQMISPCADGQERGLAVDAAQVEQCRQRAVPEREAKVAELHALLGIANYRSPQQLRPALEQLLDERLPDTTKDTLKPFKAVPGVALLMAVKELDQALKELTWLEQGLSVADGRVRPNYKILGARSGRTTTSALISSTASAVPSDTEVDKAGKPKTVKLGQVGFNFQGLTKVTKGILSTGAPDTVLLDLDWSAIEVRLQASPQLYNDDGQRQILLEGLDPHAHIASQVCGREIAPIGVDESGAKIWPPERSTIGKTANFALSYGCGQARLQRQLSLAQQRPVGPTEAQSVYSAWHRFHPQISRRMAAFDRGSRITEARTLNGRRMTVRGHKAGPDGTLPLLPLSRTNGINLPIQGTGRDLLADALGDLWPALDAYPGVRVVGLIHDEILLEVPTAQLEAVRETALAALTSSRLQQTYLGDIPLEADAKVGKSWGDAH